MKNTVLNIFLTAFVGLLLVIFFGYNFSTLSEEKVQPINSYHKKWIEAGYKNYRYTLTFGCMRGFEYKIVVKNGVKITPRKIDVYTVEELFEYADRAEKYADDYAIEYDEIGFPSKIEVNWSEEIFDDECFRGVKDFQVIKSHEL